MQYSKVRCYLGLGGNISNDLGSPKEHMERAIFALSAHEQIEDVRASSFYTSKPYGVTDQPDFINAVVSLDTSLGAYDLLDVCQELERAADRVRLRHWGERSLDVDILLYGDMRFDDERLTIPHHDMTRRNFVLVPLAEIAPDIKIAGKKISEYAASQDLTGLIRLS